MTAPIVQGVGIGPPGTGSRTAQANDASGALGIGSAMTAQLVHLSALVLPGSGCGRLEANHDGSY